MESIIVFAFLSVVCSIFYLGILTQQIYAALAENWKDAVTYGNQGLNLAVGTSACWAGFFISLYIYLT